MADSPRKSSAASEIKLEEFAEAVSVGVLRALESRSQKMAKFPGKIIIGIIYDPQSFERDVLR